MTDRKLIIPKQPYMERRSGGYQGFDFADMGIAQFYEVQNHGKEVNTIGAVPDGSVDLLFDINDDGVSTYISGTVLKYKTWSLGTGKKTFGVRFLPGCGVLPNELNMQMLVNDDIKIDGDLFGENLTDKIQEAESFNQRVSIFTEAYKGFVDKSSKSDVKKNIDIYIKDRICESYGQVSINQLCQETGYSPCYIRRVFKEYNGLSPKQFANYIRFQYLLGEIERPDKEYGQLALECGYYDEPHMMKEFKNYAGVTMNQYEKLMV